MRIAHFESSMDWGGQELRVLEQTEWLNGHGHPCWVIARPGSAIASRTRARGLPLLELDLRGSAHPATAWRLLRFLRDERIDVLDCHGSRDAHYGAWLRPFSGAAVIRSRHVSNPVRRGRVADWVWRHGNDGVIVTAELIRRHLHDQGLVAPHRVFVASAGVDEARFSPALDVSGLRAALGIDGQAKVIANVGMIRPDKGQLEYVLACRALLARHPGLVCLQIGEATAQTEAYKARVLAAAGEELARGRIRFVGYREDVENWIALADMVVIASLSTEAQTRLVSQAFLMQRNVVATTAGGLPEMIVHEGTGLLVPPGRPDALAAAAERLLADPGLAARLREAAHAHGRSRLGMGAMMQGMLAYYGQVLAAIPARRARHGSEAMLG